MWNPFLCCTIPTNMPQKMFCDWWCMFNAFVSTCEVAFLTTHGQNKKCGFDTEGFVPVYGLCGVVGSSSWFNKYLIGRTGNIWSVMYINSRSMYSSETRAGTIIECTIVLNVHHITSTWQFIYWWYDATNTSCTPCIEIPSWN